MKTQAAAFDPVSQHTVILGGAPISAIYRGRAYYFESRENREAFETSPDEYLARSPLAGSAIEVQNAQTDRPGRRGGRCSRPL